MAAAKKATENEPVVSQKWNSIHVFGYGESQIVGKDLNEKIPTDQLKSLAPLFSSLAEKGKDPKIKLDNLRVLSIHNKLYIDFTPKGNERDKNRKRLSFDEIDPKLVDALYSEITKLTSK